MISNSECRINLIQHFPPAPDDGHRIPFDQTVCETIENWRLPSMIKNGDFISLRLLVNTEIDPRTAYYFLKPIVEYCDPRGLEVSQVVNAHVCNGTWADRRRKEEQMTAMLRSTVTLCRMADRCADLLLQTDSDDPITLPQPKL